MSSDTMMASEPDHLNLVQQLLVHQPIPGTMTGNYRWPMLHNWNSKNIDIMIIIIINHKMIFVNKSINTAYNPLIFSPPKTAHKNPGSYRHIPFFCFLNNNIAIFIHCCGESKTRKKKDYQITSFCNRFLKS